MAGVSPPPPSPPPATRLQQNGAHQRQDNQVSALCAIQWQQMLCLLPWRVLHLPATAAA